MASYTSSQKAVITRIKRIGASRGASPKVIKAALETGAVESNFSNPSGGDANSAGWRQERASLYKNPTNLDASINRFYDEATKAAPKYARAGDLAAAVQRPAAQYRGRYQAVSGAAQALLGGSAAGAGASSSAQAALGPAKTPEGATRQDLLQQYVVQRGRPGALQNLALGIDSLRAQAQTAYAQGDRTGVGEALGTYLQRASTIDAKKLPYQWGGGHAGKVNPATASPLDCSGAVSAVLGVNPRVSGQFATWGKPGTGGGKGVVVYSNGEHVLMSIGGRFWGTSRSNPGGGAGWIDAPPSQSYLKGFTARHL